MKKFYYRLLVWSLVLARKLAERHQRGLGSSGVRGLLADAEGDSGYGAVRRPAAVGDLPLGFTWGDVDRLARSGE